MLPRLASLALLLPLAGLGGCRPSSGAPTPPPAAAPTAWPVTFRDVAAEAGLEFTLGHGSKTPLTVLDTANGGCAFLDYDGDRRPDILLVGQPGCKLYRNTGSGRFADMTAATGLHRMRGRWMGCTVGDYNGDGFPDVYLTGYRKSALLENRGGKSLVDVTAAAGVGLDVWTSSAAFADFDRDGLLDLYVGAFLKYFEGRKDLCQLGHIRAACGPEHYEPERGKLFRQVRPGRFEDVTRHFGVHTASGKTWGVTFSDYNTDGWPDLYLGNDMEPGNLFENQRGRGFRDVGLSSGAGYDRNGSVQGAMGVDWGDFNNDRYPDLFVTTYFRQAKSLYLNERGQTLREASGALGVADRTLPYVAFGCGFADFDNDGFLDLFLVSGHIRDNVQQFDPAQTYRQPMQLFANRGGRRFEEVSHVAGETFRHPMVGRGTSFADYDGDGRLDVLVVDLDGKTRLLRNEGKDLGGWLGVVLRGRSGNREALGAQVTLTTSEGVQVRQATRAGSVLSANDIRLHFGLGKARIKSLAVRWPSGRTTHVEGVAPGRTLYIDEPASKVQ